MTHTDEPPRAAARLGPVVLLQAPRPHAEGLPAFLLRGAAREPARVDLLDWPDAASVELPVAAGVAAVMPPDALAAAAVGSVHFGDAARGFVARRWLPGVDAKALLARLAAAPGSLDAPLAAHLAGVMLRSLAHVPPRLSGLPGDLVVGWDGRVACRDPSLALDPDRAMHDARWLSPEAMRGGALTRAARVHEVAALTFALLTGRHFVPVLDADPTAAITAVLRARRTPVLHLRPDLDRGLAQALDAGLAIDPAARPSLDAFGVALARGAAGVTEAALAALVAGLFPEAMGASLAWWDDARGLDLDGAPVLPVTASPPPVAPGQLDGAIDRMFELRARLT